jgi:hypothetical protein
LICDYFKKTGYMNVLGGGGFETVTPEDIRTTVEELIDDPGLRMDKRNGITALVDRNGVANTVRKILNGLEGGRR